jgi:DNA mismatch repair protein MutL
VHPTKQEIKFDDDKVTYAFVQSAVKHALAQFSITPTLDFELDPGIQQLDAISKPFTEQQQTQSASGSLYKTFTQANQAHVIDNSSNLKHWKDLYDIGKSDSFATSRPSVDTGKSSLYNEESIPDTTPKTSNFSASSSLIDERWQDTTIDQKVPVQVHQQYILSQIKSGFILIDQQAAHERILYERYQRALQDCPVPVQQNLFPQTLPLLPADAALISEMLPDLLVLGYDLEPFGNNTFVVRGTPADIQTGNEQASIEGLLEQFKNFSNDLKVNRREQLVRSMARNNAIPAGKSLTTREMQNVIDELFACAMPTSSPGGKYTYISFKLSDLAKMFG